MRLPYCITILALTASAQAATVWDETVDGDLSTDPLTPTPVAIALGSNTVSGSVAAPADTRDYFTFTIPAGQILTGIFLIDWTDVTSGGDGNTGFMHIDDGTSSVIPSGATALDFLGGSHLDRFTFPLTTDNVLTALAAAAAGGVGFATPLGPGDYTINVQQTGPPLTAYTLDLVITPTPGAVGILALGGLAAARRRRD